MNHSRPGQENKWRKTTIFRFQNMQPVFPLGGFKWQRSVKEGKKWLNTNKNAAIWWLTCIAGGSKKDIRYILLPNFNSHRDLD